MAIQDVPDEILDAILGNLSHHDLKNTRLVCRRWKRVAISHLFHSIAMRPNTQGFKNWRRCYDYRKIRAAARRLVIHTTATGSDEDDNVYNLKQGLEKLAATDTTESDLKGFNALGLIAKFPLVTEVCIAFSPLVIGEFSGMIWPTAETIEERKKALQDIFKAIRKRNRKEDMTKINRLAIRNLQNVPMRDFTSTRGFKWVMEHVEHLDLHVSTEKTQGFANEMPHQERWTFEPHLQKAWITPWAPQLISLSLAFDDDSYFGALPGTFNPQGVSFPKLEHLKLRRFAVAHNDHLDWVLEMPSLKRLTLDGCRIVCNAWVGDQDAAEWELATHDWLRMPPEAYHFRWDPRNHTDSYTLYRFPGTWEDVFDKIRRRLPNLEEFVFEGPWASRYVAFQSGGWPMPWTWADDKGKMEFGDGVGIKGKDVVNRARETDRGDVRALDELRTAVIVGPVVKRAKRKRHVPGKAVGMALIKPLSPLIEFCRDPSRWLMRRFGCRVCQGLEDI